MPNVTRSIEIQASPETVWSLMSTVEGLRQWWEPKVEIDLQVGGTYRFHVEEADTWISGYVLEMIPGVSLSLSWLEEGGDWQFPIRLTFTLEAIPGGTRVTKQFDGFAGIGKATWARTRDAYQIGSEQHKLLEVLKQVVEAHHAA